MNHQINKYSNFKNKLKKIKDQKNVQNKEKVILLPHSPTIL